MIVLNLRKELSKLLKEYHPNVIRDGKSMSRVHFQTTSDERPYPYITFNLPNSFSNEQQEVFVLDVDIWDNKDDSKAIDELASLLWKKLNYYEHVDEDIQFSIYRDIRLPPLDEKERNLKRRKLTFQLRYFDRRLFD